MTEFVSFVFVGVPLEVAFLRGEGGEIYWILEGIAEGQGNENRRRKKEEDGNRGLFDADDEIVAIGI